MISAKHTAEEYVVPKKVDSNRDTIFVMWKDITISLIENKGW